MIVGVPLIEKVSELIQKWEDEDDERWDDSGCGFETLYSAGDQGMIGYCGVKLDSLETYTPQLVSAVNMVPTEKQNADAAALVAKLDPELREAAGPFGVYFIWSDS